MTVVMLAIAVPGLLAIAWLGLRRVQSMPMVRSLALAKGVDARGIALQTVIIIVVLLAIAGAIAAVLLSTGAEVASDLEQSDVTGRVDTQAECEAFSMGGVDGTWAAAGTCTWTAASNGANPTDVTSTQCRIVRGVYTAGGSSTAATCVITA